MSRLFIALLVIPALLWGQDSLKFTRLGSVDDYWDDPEDIVTVGSMAYAATGHTGLRMIDISNPAEPIEVGAFDSTGLVYAVAVSGSYAYLAQSNGLFILDVSVPSQPQFVGSLGGYTHVSAAICVSGGIAYWAQDSDSLRIVDVSDPTSPRDISFFERYNTPYEISVVDTLLFVTDGRALKILDVSDPNTPELVGTYNSSSTIRDFVIDGSYAIIALCGDSLHVVDLSNLAAPEYVMHYRTDYCTGSLEKVGAGIYVATWNHAIHVMTFANMHQPAQISHIEARNMRFLSASGNQVVALGEEAFVIYDLNTPILPVELGRLTEFRRVQHIIVAEPYVYSLEEYDGIRILDFSDPSNPVVAGSYDTPGWAADIAVSDTIAYVADGDSGVRILDISDPSNITEIGSLQFINAYNLAVAENHLFVAQDEFIVFDIGNLSAPIELGRCNPISWPRGIALSGNYAYLASHSALSIVDISNPAEPMEIGSYLSAEGFEDVAVSGTLVFASYNDYANYRGGVMILDCTDPTNPIYVGTRSGDAGAGGVAVSGTHVYLADGLTTTSVSKVFDFSDLPSIPRVGSIPSRLWSKDIAVVGDRVYMAESQYVCVYDIDVYSSVNDRTTIPSQFSLHPIYPNPFNNTANIAFDLPREVTGRLVVYDVLGRMTNTLFDGKLTAGSHQMQFNASNLSSGAYFVRLETPSFSATQKAVLLK